MTIIAKCKGNGPERPLFKAHWQQAYLPGDVGPGLDWYVTTGGVPRKVQRDFFTDNVFTCQVKLAQGTTDFTLEDGAHTTPANEWVEPTLTGLKMQWDGHETPSRCRHEASLTDITRQKILRDGHLERAVERYAMTTIVTQGSGNQTVGTRILTQHVILHFRADVADVVEIEILLSNAAGQINTQGQGLIPATAPTTTAFTNAKLILPAGWEKLVDRPLAEEDSIPAPTGSPLYTSDAHCFPRKAGTVRRWVIYKIATAGAAAAAQDILEERGLYRATAQGPRSYHSVPAFGPMKTRLPDIDDVRFGNTSFGSFGTGTAGADAQSLNAWGTLNGAAATGTAGGGTGGEFGHGFDIGRLGLFHPVGEAFPGAPGGDDIEVYCSRRYTPNFVRYLKLHTGAKVDSSGVFLFENTTGEILRTRDFGDAYLGTNVPGFVSGAQFAGRMPFHCTAQNDSGYEYKPQGVQTFGGWTPRSTSWPAHFLGDDSGQPVTYKRWFPEPAASWGTAPRSLWNFKCDYRPILEQVPVRATPLATDNNGKPTYIPLRPHKESAPTNSGPYGEYTWKDPEDAQHAVRMFAKLISLAWLSGDLMAVKLIDCYAEWFGFEYCEVGTLDLVGTDPSTVAENNKSLKRRLEIQQQAPHTARYGTGRADAWAAWGFSAQLALSTPAKRNDGYPNKGIRKRAEMMLDFIGTGLITANGHSNRSRVIQDTPGHYISESGAIARAFGMPGGGLLPWNGPPIPSIFTSATQDFAAEQAGLELPKLQVGLYSLACQLGRHDYDQHLLKGFTDYVARVERYTSYSPNDNGLFNGQMGPFNCVATWNNITNQPTSGVDAPSAWIGSGGHYDDVSVMLEIAYRISGDPSVFIVANYLGIPAPRNQAPAVRAQYWINGTAQYALGLVQLMRTQPGPDVALPPPPAPTFQAIQPTSALPAATCRVFGTGFSNPSTAVTIGGLALVNPTTFGDTLIVGRIPALAAGAWDVVITSSAGQAIGPMAFTSLAVNPGPGAPTIDQVKPPTGMEGELVHVQGTGFDALTWAVTFDGIPLVRAVRNSDVEIQGYVPAGLTPGLIDVTVTTVAGSVTATDAFTFLVPAGTPPTVKSVTPLEGIVGTQITIVGEGFSAGGAVATLGGIPLGSPMVIGDGLIQGVVPPLAPGTYPLVVTTTAGTGALSTAFLVLETPGPDPEPPPISMPRIQIDMHVAVTLQANLSAATRPPVNPTESLVPGQVKPPVVIDPPVIPPTGAPPDEGAPSSSPLAITFEAIGDQAADNVLLSWSTAGGEFRIVDGDLQRESGLAAAVLLSLFSDARTAPDPTKPINDQDLRGWWGETAPDRYGSHLWLLERAKATTETLRRAQDYAFAALQWMIQQRIAREVQIHASYKNRTMLVLDVVILRGDARRWARLWQGALDVKIRAGDVLLQLQGS